MIHKVKPAVSLKLVHSSKRAKNDLGGQSGEAYSKDHPQKQNSQSQKNDAVPALSKELEPEEAPSETAPISEQVGLTHVVKEWLEKKADFVATSQSNASQKYQGESAPAKGMLLNKKIS